MTPDNMPITKEGHSLVSFIRLVFTVMCINSAVTTFFFRRSLIDHENFMQFFSQTEIETPPAIRGTGGGGGGGWIGLDGNRVTMVVMTYKRTQDLIQNPLFKDIVPLDVVAELLIIWNDVNNTSDIEVVQKHCDDNGIGNKVRFHVPEKNSMNNRFEPLPGIRTEAIYSTDDEWTTSVENFQTAFGLWQFNKYRLVGFTPRKVELSPQNKGQYITFGTRPDIIMEEVKRKRYNILLPGGGLFFHKSILDIYGEQTPDKIAARDYVDRVFNCDDLLLNFMIPKEFHPPLLVMVNGNSTSEEYRRNNGKGISDKPGHYKSRAECLSFFHNIFGWPFIDSKTVATTSLSLPSMSNASSSSSA